MVLQLFLFGSRSNFLGFHVEHTTLHTTAVLLLKLSRVGPGQVLDGRPDAAGSGVGGPVGGTLSSGLKKYPNAPG
jgi:hypothetical protein